MQPDLAALDPVIADVDERLAALAEVVGTRRARSSPDRRPRAR